MANNPRKPGIFRPILVGLSIFLTATAISALTSGCGSGFFNNDWKDHGTAPATAYDAHSETGSSAVDFLAADRFKSLRVEIQSMPGQAPSQDALNRLQRFLAEHLNKPRGIQIVIDDDIKAGSGRYSVVDIREAEDRHRKHFSHKDLLTAYVLFVDGHSVDDQPGAKLLGQAHRSGSIVIYENSIREEVAKVAGLSLSLAEATVLAHEFGHLFGLVNLGVASKSLNHEDAKHPSHCGKEGCLMHYAIENSTNLQALLSGETPKFDTECSQTLKAAGGK